ncbi:AbrB/MazE/SpoVT family DNA-binding domain-containing protein [Acidobacteria bacterium ACD]|nr:MAG: AbrB/MazE/SpoVT family DNA-binding domain-containing protein [Acidobacteriota bacterium]MCE7957379.1 AbrB/MazE/SpoVT family DNA-binding domain-containing protein [Acidobacteria bacterium ACB2]MDL1949279.1 AbrB/MazE/SpoVT family DNA-binding domain-containing protein [Acidobacteria bacterium ACD]
MHSKVQKWGNSLALRIPKAFALEIGLSEDAAVDVSVRQGHLVVAPLKSPTYALADLVSGISRRNVHAEAELGPAQGREVW